jgi:Trk K+ transport system NAD-binding subunit
VRGDYSSAEVLGRIDWEGVELAIIFHEHTRGRTAVDVDIRNVIAAMQVAGKARVIVEVVNEEYADVLRRCGEGDIELIFKERIDANFIANTIVNPGATTRLLADLVDFEGQRIEAVPLSELWDGEEATLRDVALRLAQEPEPVILLGVLPRGETAPVLNPPGDTVVGAEDLVYCLRAR